MLNLTVKLTLIIFAKEYQHSLHTLTFSLSIKSLKLLYNALSYLILAIVLLYVVIRINQRAIRAIYNLQNRINTDEFYNSLKIFKILF